ncbi:hypothetical protein XENOCAPTIV_018365 [Xenoophorus captivus]|uniref:Uncharacterized protein n=1 Tax=Xenoophorus captivus TaxID=1517983 RepID=A0ABV0S8X7_9TELE
MLPASLHSGFLRCSSPDRMFPPNKDLADSRQVSARDRWVQRQMEEAMKHLPSNLEVLPSPLLLEEMELAPAGPGCDRGAVVLFTFLSREAEKTLRRSAGLSVPQSAFDGSRGSPDMESNRTGDRSPSSPFFFSSPSYGSEALVLLPPQETPAWSTFLCFSRRGGVSRRCCCHAWSGNSLARWREGCSKYSRIFVCHSTIFQARCSSVHAVFARSSPVL